MVRKIRKQVYIEDHQERRLKQQARLLKVRESELIRKGLDLVLRQQRVGLPDRQAWKAELDFIRSRATLPSGLGKRAWSREELYEERLSRRHQRARLRV
jgi:hypothetical protein